MSLCLFTLSGLGPACRPIPSSIGWRDDRSFVSPSPITPNHPSTSLIFNKFSDTHICTQTHTFIHGHGRYAVHHKIPYREETTRPHLRLSFCT